MAACHSLLGYLPPEKLEKLGTSLLSMSYIEVGRVALSLHIYDLHLRLQASGQGCLICPRGQQTLVHHVTCSHLLKHSLDQPLTALELHVQEYRWRHDLQHLVQRGHGSPCKPETVP